MKNSLYFIKTHNLTNMILFLFLVATIISFSMNPDSTFEHCTLLFAIVASLLANRQFFLQTTFNKLNTITASPSVSEYIVRVITLIDNEPEKITIKHIESDWEIYVSVSFVLGLCDDIGAAVRQNIISEKVVLYSQGRFIMKVYRGLKPYINQLAQQKKGSYRGLEFLEWKWRNNEYVNIFEKKCENED